LLQGVDFGEEELAEVGGEEGAGLVDGGGSGRAGAEEGLEKVKVWEHAVGEAPEEKRRGGGKERREVGDADREEEVELGFESGGRGGEEELGAARDEGGDVGFGEVVGAEKGEDGVRGFGGFQVEFGGGGDGGRAGEAAGVDEEVDGEGWVDTGADARGFDADADGRGFSF